MKELLFRSQYELNRIPIVDHLFNQGLGFAGHEHIDAFQNDHSFSVLGQGLGRKT